MENNRESQKRQYQLKERAIIDLGWREKDCIVIDDDLGISGADSENRQGYQKLLAMIALREVGIIFGIEVSRLSRNCLDWYKLLEVASCFSCLIGDEDGIYDPLDFNDRLLLGLKGTISEAELYQIRNKSKITSSFIVF
jgi:DNA invertase Pin-like site-specific DNA recombinase